MNKPGEVALLRSLRGQQYNRRQQEASESNNTIVRVVLTSELWLERVFEQVAGDKRHTPSLSSAADAYCRGALHCTPTPSSKRDKGRRGGKGAEQQHLGGISKVVAKRPSLLREHAPLRVAARHIAGTLIRGAGKEFTLVGRNLW